MLLLGRVDGEPFRTEVTLLPETRIIEWQGQQVETLVSQYVAYLDGRIHEVAYDFYAQDDAGAVWYFGEDVFNFADGVIVDTHGTWIAGKDGPAAMIMPADPQVGDVYRPENIPGFVFEEVTVKAVDQTLDGPSRPCRGRAPDRGAPHGRDDRGEDLRRRATASSLPAAAATSRRSPWQCPPMRSPSPRRRSSSRSRARRRSPSTRPRRRTGGRLGPRSSEMTAAWETARAGEVPDRLGPQMSRALGGARRGRSRRAIRARRVRRRSTSRAGASTCSSVTDR